MIRNLSACPPFSFESVTHSHGWTKLAPFNADEKTSGLNYIDHLSSGRVVDVALAGTAEGVQVEADAVLDPEEEVELTRKVTWMLGLDQDFSEFYTLARSEPKLAAVETGAKGRLLRCPTLFEDVVKTILTTNTAWGGTIRMVNALVAEFGAPLSGDPARRAFPTPGRIAQSNEEVLRQKVRVGYRAPYILELARRVASGELDLEAFKDSALSTIRLRKKLLALKGVGEYAAANLLMIIGHYDFIPVDSWAVKLVSHEWYDGAPVGKSEVEKAFEHWGPWKGLAFWFWDWDLFQEEAESG